MKVRQAYYQLSDMKEEMNAALQVKRQKRLNKYQLFHDYFVMSLNSFTKFFSKLNKHGVGLPNGTRFQIAVTGEISNHWSMIDCYVENGQLNTLIVEAGTPKLKDDKVGGMFHHFWPNGKHFYYYDPETQELEHQSWALTRRYISIISKLDPTRLYADFANEKLPDELVREKQRYHNLSNAGQADTSQKNQYIERKEVKYLHSFFNDKPKFSNDRTGFGLLVLPNLGLVKQQMLLEKYSLTEIKQSAGNIIDTLHTFPKYRKAVKFFKAKHADKTAKVISKIQHLIDTEQDKSMFIEKFADILYSYAGYLEKQDSDRTLVLLIKAVHDLRKHYEGLMSKPPSAILFAN